GDWYGAALSLNVLGKVECYLGNYAEAHHLCHQSLGLKRVVGDEWGVSFCYTTLGDVAVAMGHYAQAGQQYRAALQIREKLGDVRRTAVTWEKLGNMARLQPEYGDAHQFYQRALQVHHDYGDVIGMTTMQSRLGQLARENHAYDGAREAYHLALKTAVTHRLTPQISKILTELGHMFVESKMRLTSPQSKTDISVSTNDWIVETVLAQFSRLLEQANEQQNSTNISENVAVIMRDMPIFLSN
ncbi:MAG: tetratricopeptide repeat protein, partial [Chloroflexi bacterium]|nr:tetratricopeptide repeat protein [Chloroflexota bacterium]